jgi:hypothetical protein
MMIHKGLEELSAAARGTETADAINSLGEAVQEGLYGLSNAIYDLAAAVRGRGGAGRGSDVS